MRPLTVQKIIEVQRWLILHSVHQEDEGMAGRILSPGTLETLVMHANTLQTPSARAAWMLHGITTRHPFYQGNKRTAFAVAEIILMLSPEQKMINAADEEINRFVRGIAQYLYTVDDVEDWIIRNCNAGDD